MRLIIDVDIDGEDVKVKHKIVDGETKNHDFSTYAKWFDENCVGWTKDPEYNVMFLKSQQKYCNDILRAKGHLFLNEVYDILGIPRTKVGQIVGWIYDEGNPDGNFVDFGLSHDRNCEFINGFSAKALLDFNVHGNILDRI